MTLRYELSKIGLTEAGYRERIRRGWSEEKALTTPKMTQGSGIRKAYKCKYYKDGIGLYQWCKKNKMSYSAIRLKMKLFDMSVDEAIEEYKNNVQNPALTHNLRYVKDGMSLRAYCIKNGLNYATELCKIYRDSPDKIKVDYEIQQRRYTAVDWYND